MFSFKHSLWKSNQPLLCFVHFFYSKYFLLEGFWPVLAAPDLGRPHLGWDKSGRPFLPLAFEILAMLSIRRPSMLSAPLILITIKNWPKKVAWASKVGLEVFVRFLAQKQTFLKKFSLGRICLFEIVTQKTKLSFICHGQLVQLFFWRQNSRLKSQFRTISTLFTI